MFPRMISILICSIRFFPFWIYFRIRLPFPIFFFPPTLASLPMSTLSTLTLVFMISNWSWHYLKVNFGAAFYCQVFHLQKKISLLLLNPILICCCLLLGYPTQCVVLFLHFLEGPRTGGHAVHCITQTSSDQPSLDPPHANIDIFLVCVWWHAINSPLDGQYELFRARAHVHLLCTGGNENQNSPSGECVNHHFTNSTNVCRLLH